MMNNGDWIRITPAANIPPREGRSVQLGDLEVAIFNLGGRFVAIENRCPHKGGPLADGIISTLGDAVTVTCPLHNWRVCVDSGSVRKPGSEAACVRSFPVKVEGGVVMISKEAPVAA
jgi:nitrite reductase (NADH) small subunit